MKTLALLLLAALSAAAANWTDRAEYDLVLGVRAELVPQKRLPLLDQWKAKYPKSEHAQVRRELYFAAYQAMDDSAHMLDTAAEMLTAQPGQPIRRLLVHGLAARRRARPPRNGSLSAKRPRPTGRPDPTNCSPAARSAWIHWQRNEYPAAEDGTPQVPGAGSRREPRLRHGSARCSRSNSSPRSTCRRSGIWPAPPPHCRRGQKRPMAGVLDRLYTSYHGETAGLDQLLMPRPRKRRTRPPASTLNRRP